MKDRSPATPIRRYWRLVAIMATVAAIAIVAALWYLQRSGTPLRLHVALATGLGVGLTLLLAGVLMGLVFFSARSGHDQAVSDETRDSDEL
jgi:tetrahydromethanopterin S-methyltransferase subunit D